MQNLQSKPPAMQVLVFTTSESLHTYLYINLAGSTKIHTYMKMFGNHSVKTETSPEIIVYCELYFTTYIIRIQRIFINKNIFFSIGWHSCQSILINLLVERSEFEIENVKLSQWKIKSGIDFKLARHVSIVDQFQLSFISEFIQALQYVFLIWFTAKF